MSALLQQMKQDNPSVLYPLNESGGTVAFDVSGNSRNGTFVGGPTFGAVGPAGMKAISFDGVDDALSTPSIDFTTTSAITVALWYYRTSDAVQDILITEMSVNYNNVTTGLLLADREGVTAQIQSALKGDVGYNDGRYNFSVGTWACFHAVYNKGAVADSEVTLYIDGVITGAVAGVQANNNINNFGNHPLYFMSRAATSIFRPGRLSHIGVYPTALSSDRIKAHYQAGLRSGTVMG